MVEMYSHILNSMMEVFASIISNNLNLVMKFFSIRNDYTGHTNHHRRFMGMNVPVPLSDSPYGFLVIGGTSLLVAGVTGYWLWKRRMF